MNSSLIHSSGILKFLCRCWLSRGCFLDGRAETLKQNIKPINNASKHFTRGEIELNSVIKSELRRYIELRLGKGTEVEQMQKMFKKSFQAKTFREFWWYWNPTYGFFLGKYIYKPLRTFLPQSISVIFTFIACGLFLYDLLVMLFVSLLMGPVLLFPITIFFTILGLINVISTKYKLSFDDIKPHGRIAIHLFTLMGSLITAVQITKIILVFQING